MMNTIVNPDTQVAADEHKHQCACGTTWKHNDDCSKGTVEHFDQAHTCPGCGETVTKKLMTDEEAEAKLAAMSECERLDMVWRALFR